jgi:chromosome segregation ATPase
MTVDERIEFLMQSIESHDRQIGELVERMDKTAANIDALGSKVDALSTKVDKLVETTQLNFDRLTTAMLGLTEHVADHQRRIERLER